MVKAKKSASKMKRKSGNGKSAANKAMAKKATNKLPAIKEPLSKSSLIKAIAECMGLSKKEVTSFFDNFAQIIEKHLKGPGVFVLPGLAKFYVVKKPARPARKGVNPFTGEEMMFKSKPACKVVKIKPLKGLKEVVA